MAAWPTPSPLIMDWLSPTARGISVLHTSFATFFFSVCSVLPLAVAFDRSLWSAFWPIKVHVDALDIISLLPSDSFSEDDSEFSSLRTKLSSSSFAVRKSSSNTDGKLKELIFVKLSSFAICEDMDVPVFVASNFSNARPIPFFSGSDIVGEKTIRGSHSDSSTWPIISRLAATDAFAIVAGPVKLAFASVTSFCSCFLCSFWLPLEISPTSVCASSTAAVHSCSWFKISLLLGAFLWLNTGPNASWTRASCRDFSIFRTSPFLLPDRFDTTLAESSNSWYRLCNKSRSERSMTDNKLSPRSSTPITVSPL